MLQNNEAAKGGNKRNSSGIVQNSQGTNDNRKSQPGRLNASTLNASTPST
jgi:hypothetical protein